eukprot:8718609-Alexandrium_andersonii.AAC.1
MLTVHLPAVATVNPRALEWKQATRELPSAAVFCVLLFANQVVYLPVATPLRPPTHCTHSKFWLDWCIPGVACLGVGG